MMAIMNNNNTLQVFIMRSGRIFDSPSTYQIRLFGNIDPKWSDWFDGFTIKPQPNQECLMTGVVLDQAALHGLLTKIRDLALPIISVQRIEEDLHTSKTG
jgi:hypothetical protein